MSVDVNLGMNVRSKAIGSPSKSGKTGETVVRLPMVRDHGLRMASFFSGIGGFELGFERAGFTTTFQCEIDKFCNTILKQHWPNVKRATNIKDISSTDVPLSDVWAGGFPCQDVSLARMGTRAGLRGSRSGLFHDFARVLGEGRPRVVLLENVHGLLSSHKGKDFEVVIRTLAELGYAVGWRVLNSKNFGVPQSRQRVYIVGCYQDPQGPGQILFEPKRSKGYFEKNGSDETDSLSPFKRVIRATGGERPVVQSIAYCLYATSARHTGTDWSRTYVNYPHKGSVRRLMPDECEGIMSFPAGWTLNKSLDENKYDVDSLRYHALGNAVTPPVAEWLAQRVANYLVAATSLHRSTGAVEQETLRACV